MKKAFQDNYADDFNHCYGCGALNEHGLKIKSYWDGEESVAHFTPREYHTAVPGFVYGGLIASLIDCHSTGTGAAALFKESGENGNYPRCVTASLHVDYIKPTPIDCELELRGKVKKIDGRKVTVLVDLIAKGKVCAKGKVMVMSVPEGWKPKF